MKDLAVRAAYEEGRTTIMNQGPIVVREGKDPELPIHHQVFGLGNTLLLAKYDVSDGSGWFRWNSEASLEDILRLHTCNNAPEWLSTPFIPDLVLTGDGLPVPTEQIRWLGEYLKQDDIERSDQELSELLSGIGSIGIMSTDESIKVCWNANPEREFVGDQSTIGLSSIEVEASHDVLSPPLLAWYLSQFPPRTGQEMPNEMVLAERIIDSVIN